MKVNALHLRSLLDQACQKIHTLGQFSDNPGDAGSLSKDALEMVYSPQSKVRQKGNQAAHPSEKNGIREAVAAEALGSKRRRVLEELFRFVFQEEYV